MNVEKSWKDRYVAASPENRYASIGYWLDRMKDDFTEAVIHLGWAAEVDKELGSSTLQETLKEMGYAA